MSHKQKLAALQAQMDALQKKKKPSKKPVIVDSESEEEPSEDEQLAAAVHASSDDEEEEGQHGALYQSKLREDSDEDEEIIKKVTHKRKRGSKFIDDEAQEVNGSEAEEEEDDVDEDGNLAALTGKKPIDMRSVKKVTKVAPKPNFVQGNHIVKQPAVKRVRIESKPSTAPKRLTVIHPAPPMYTPSGKHIQCGSTFKNSGGKQFIVTCPPTVDAPLIADAKERLILDYKKLTPANYATAYDGKTYSTWILNSHKITREPLLITRDHGRDIANQDIVENREKRFALAAKHNNFIEHEDGRRELVTPSSFYTAHCARVNRKAAVVPSVIATIVPAAVEIPVIKPATLDLDKLRHYYQDPMIDAEVQQFMGGLMTAFFADEGFNQMPGAWTNHQSTMQARWKYLLNLSGVDFQTELTTLYGPKALSLITTLLPFIMHYPRNLANQRLAEDKERLTPSFVDAPVIVSDLFSGLSTPVIV